jgi:hypothetical protein
VYGMWNTTHDTTELHVPRGQENLAGGSVNDDEGSKKLEKKENRPLAPCVIFLVQ